MDNAVELTEMTELAADELHLVKTGASGFSPLLEKAVRDEIEGAAKSDSPEADEIEKLLTGAAKSLCGSLDCTVCAPTLSKMPISDTLKERLTSASRDALPDSEFVFPKSRKYPIHDEGHARNALSRVAGKGSKEKKVKAAVAANFPNIDQAEKSPGNPKGSTKVPSTADALPTWPSYPQHESVPHLGESEVAKIKTVDPSAGHGDPAEGPVGAGAAPKIPGANSIPNSKGSIAGMTRKMFAYGTLAEFLERVEAQQEGRAIKEPWVAKPNPEANDGTVEPTLKEAADTLSKVFSAIAEGKDREMIKSFQLSDFSTQSLSKARDQLTTFLSDRPTSTTTEASEIMIQMTKEDLAKQIADGAKSAVDSALKEQGKELKKTAKLIRRALKQSSNNKGEVTAEGMKGKVKGKRSADDVAIPGSGVTKSDTVVSETVVVAPPVEKVKKGKKGKKGGIKKQLSEIQELVEKFGKRPVVGGPHLTGTPTAAAAEGRQGEQVVKSAEDAKIESLQKQLADELKSSDPGAANRVSQLSWELSRAQLSQGHRLGQI